jgi:hypothetical protein
MIRKGEEARLATRGGRMPHEPSHRQQSLLSWMHSFQTAEGAASLANEKGAPPAYLALEAPCAAARCTRELNFQ